MRGRHPMTKQLRMKLHCMVEIEERALLRVYV